MIIIYKRNKYMSTSMTEQTLMLYYLQAYQSF